MCLTTHTRPVHKVIFSIEKKWFCLLFYENLSPRIVYANRKICHWLLWNACAPSCRVSNRFTYMAINTPSPNEIAFRNSNRFLSLYSCKWFVVQCHLTQWWRTRFASNPFSLSLSFWLCLNQSIYFQIASWVQEQGLLSLLGWNIKSMHTPIYRVGFNFYLILMGIKLALSVVKDILFQIQGPLYSWRRESDGEWMCWINADLRKLGGVGQALRHWPVVILHLLPWGE